MPRWACMHGYASGVCVCVCMRGHAARGHAPEMHAVPGRVWQVACPSFSIFHRRVDALMLACRLNSEGGVLLQPPPVHGPPPDALERIKRELNASCINLHQLKRLAFYGLPDSNLRSTVWKVDANAFFKKTQRIRASSVMWRCAHAPRHAKWHGMLTTALALRCFVPHMLTTMSERMRSTRVRTCVVHMSARACSHTSMHADGRTREAGLYPCSWSCIHVHIGI